MTNTNGLRPGLVITALGLIAVAVLAYTLGGWGRSTDGVTAITRTDEATADTPTTATGTATATASLADLVQACLDKSANDPSRSERLALLQQATDDTRRDLLMDTGWATVSGSAPPNPEVAQACLDALVFPTP